MKPSLLYFDGSWCKPCVLYEPIVRACAKKANIPLMVLHVDRHTAEAKRYNITGVPALVLLRKGQPPKVAHGPKTAKRLKGWLSD